MTISRVSYFLSRVKVILTCFIVYAVGGYLFNFFEPSFSIVAACMPVLRKIFKDALQWKKDSPGSNWVPNRRKKGAALSVLPMTESKEDLAAESKSNSDKTDKTDTTLATSTGTVIPTAKSLCPIGRVCDISTKPSEL